MTTTPGGVVQRRGGLLGSGLRPRRHSARFPTRACGPIPKPALQRRRPADYLYRRRTPQRAKLGPPLCCPFLRRTV